MFRDRVEAGEKLAAREELQKYRGDDNTLILAVPNGGVPVGTALAKRLDLDFNIIICRKIMNPYSPESGIGALGETGEAYWHPAAQLYREELRRKMMDLAGESIKNRVELLRKDLPFPRIKGRNVIIVDDGLAMGSTMRTAIKTVRKLEAGKIIVALPVAGERALPELREKAHEIVILESPPDFHAVAQVYIHWRDMSLEETLGYLKSSGRKNAPA